MPFTTLPPEWKTALSKEFNKSYFEKLSSDVSQAYKTETVFPPKEMVFNALKLCPFNDIKVVIIGQDPYHKKKSSQRLKFFC